MDPVRNPQVDQVDDYFGTQVRDPYRWLEGSAEDPRIRSWVRLQAAAAREHLDTLPNREQIEHRVRSLAQLPTETAPRHAGDRWFRFANDGRQEQLVYRVSDSVLDPGRTLIDPNPLTANSTTSISAAVPSPDGRLVAYTMSEAGSDWQTWRVRSVADGADLPDVVPWAKFTVASWLADGSGFFYGGFTEPEAGADTLTGAQRGHQLRLHRLGTSAREDQLILALTDEPEVIFEPEVTEDGRWLVISGVRGTDPTNRLWVLDLQAAESPMTPRALIATDDAAWTLVGGRGGTLVLLTDQHAPRRRLIALDTSTGEVTELISERAEILADAWLAGGRLIAHWLVDAHSALTVHAAGGSELGSIPLPGLGCLTELTARDDAPTVQFGYSDFATAKVTVQHDLDTAEQTELFAASAPELADVVTEQVWFTSRDGTPIPMFLVHRGGTPDETGPRPTLLWGYGGFRVPVLPAFNVSRAAFVSAGGVLAVPTLRGGGEYGAPWHDAGRLANKQNVFDDAIAAAEYLIAERWTTAGQLACNGGSNGGLLVGALITQRPDLFAAAVPEVGVLDLLRFTHFTIGWAWTSDYGDPERSESDFLHAYAYSPYHRLRSGLAYPPTLIMTSDHDDRVVPAHSYKFAARLQEVSAAGATALLRVEIDAGHGAGRARSAVVAERTDALSFISAAVGLSW